MRRAATSFWRSLGSAKRSSIRSPRRRGRLQPPSASTRGQLGGTHVLSAEPGPRSDRGRHPEAVILREHHSFVELPTGLSGVELPSPARRHASPDARRASRQPHRRRAARPWDGRIPRESPRNPDDKARPRRQPRDPVWRSERGAAEGLSEGLGSGRGHRDHGTPDPPGSALPRPALQPGHARRHRPDPPGEPDPARPLAGRAPRLKELMEAAGS